MFDYKFISTVISTLWFLRLNLAELAWKLTCYVRKTNYNIIILIINKYLKQNVYEFTIFQELARQLVITSCHVESPVAILNAVDGDNTPFIDVLIQCDQKMVIAEFVVQQYLQENMN